MVSKHFTKLLYFCRFCCNGKYLEIEVKEKKLYFCQFKKKIKKISIFINDDNRLNLKKVSLLISYTANK